MLIPIIELTTHTEGEEQNKMFVAGIDIHVSKPLNKQKVLKVIKELRYAVTSLEKVHKPQLYVEPDLGIPLGLLDLSVYNAPKDEIRHVAPEDERLLQEDIVVSPIKKDGLKRKERPTDKGFSWLVKTQYISPLSMEATRHEFCSAKQETKRNPAHDADNPVHLESRPTFDNRPWQK